MKPNASFNLDVNDIEHIDNALRYYQSSLESDKDKKEIINILAKIHHQKNWYRPKNSFVGG